MTTNPPTHPAIEFLKKLDSSPDATFNIEHYTDLPKGKKKPKPDPLSGRYANLTIPQVEALLTQLHFFNDRGAAICVARNQCTGQREEKTITRMRGVHGDWDGPTPDQLATVTAILEPSITVRSSLPDKYHLYFQLSDGEVLGKDEAKAINQRLVEYGADPAAVDVSRLLRVPGFKHMKYADEGKCPVVTATYKDCAYTADEIRAAFPPKMSSRYKNTTQKKKQKTSNKNTQVPPSQLTAVAAMIEAKYPKLWSGDWAKVVRSSGEIGYKSKSEADLALAGHIARAVESTGINTAKAPEAVLSIFNSSKLGDSEKWQSREDYRMLTINKAISSLLEIDTLSDQQHLELESHGDVKNAKAFAQVTRGFFIYVVTRGVWLRWQDSRWQLCEKEEHIAKAKEVCGSILAAAGYEFTLDQERGKKLIQEAIAAHNLPRITAMLKLAVSEPEMATTDRELDSDPYLLGVRNGVVDLRSSQLLLNQPELLVTRYCNAAFEDDATCPRWTVFLDQVFEGDIETIESVQRLLGCTLLGLGTEEILIICYGHGSNGKSVFSNVVHKILSGYAITAPPSLLTVRRKDDTGPRNDLAALAGARYVSINETQAGERLDEQVVKILAGREPISARFLNREFFEFDPTFTPWLRTNHKPVIFGEDDGIWRRLILIRFGRKFTDDEKDPYLEEKLLDESNGILMWMIEGARLYLESGIRQSPRMLAELSVYRKESDLLGEFLSDHTTTGPSFRANQSTIYKEYRDWTESCGVRALSKKSFTQRLAERGYREGKSGNARYYTGLKLSRENSALPPTQDGVGRISSNLPLSENIDSYKEKTGNSLNPVLPALADHETDEEAR